MTTHEWATLSPDSLRLMVSELVDERDEIVHRSLGYKLRAEAAEARVAELENNGPAGINLGRAINAELRIAAVLDELADCTWGCGDPGNEMLTPCSTCRVRAILLP